MLLPAYPESIPIGLDLQGSLIVQLDRVTSGISEFTFAGLYLFRATYGYRVSALPGGNLVLLGSKNGQSFFSVPRELPEEDLLERLLQDHDFGKNLSRLQAEEVAPLASRRGWLLEPDRNNWDYLYDRKEMAELVGKKFHKKRNLIHQFHQHHSYTAEPLTDANLEEALRILQLWALIHPEANDAVAAREALKLRERLGLSGQLYRVSGKAAGYTLGEEIGKTGTYVIHFEKADPSYRGIYQVIFRDFASSLPYPIINREQDLGDLGLRQSKETYRPVGFVEKLTLRLQNGSDLAQKNTFML